MWNKNIQTFIGCESTFEEAEIVLFGAPFDGTTSFRPGTRFGPGAIRCESFGIETYSPYQQKDLTQLKVYDGGDLELPFGSPQRVLSQIETYTNQILSEQKLPVMLGGEHLITLGAVSAAAKKYPDLHILHFDAHADLREDYLGETLSHACVMRRIWEILGDNRIYQFGIRSGDQSEFQFANLHTIMEKFDFDGLDQAIALLKHKPVYLSIDLDVLDPSVFCGTGTPEAGGCSFQQLLQIILKTRDLTIVGCDINELSPVYDQSGVSTAVACKLLRELLLTIGGK